LQLAGSSGGIFKGQWLNSWPMVISNGYECIMQSGLTEATSGQGWFLVLCFISPQACWSAAHPRQRGSHSLAQSTCEWMLVLRGIYFLFQSCTPRQCWFLWHSPARSRFLHVPVVSCRQRPSSSLALSAAWTACTPRCWGRPAQGRCAAVTAMQHAKKSCQRGQSQSTTACKQDWRHHVPGS